MSNFLAGSPGYIGQTETPGTDPNAWHNTGDAFGASGVLGSLDAFDVLVYAGGLERGRVWASTPRWDFGVQGDEPLLTIASSHAAARWRYATGSALNTDAVTYDHVVNFGWNCGALGGAIDPTEPVLCDSWESNYLTGATRFCERHWNYVSTLGVARRPMGILVDRALNTSQIGLAGKVIIGDSTGTRIRMTMADDSAANSDVLCTWGEGGTGVTHLVQKNNISAYEGLGSGGGRIPLLKVDAAGAGVDANDVVQFASGNPVNLSGRNITATAGAGALSLAAMTGACALPTGSLSWAGADAAKTLSLVSLGAATITGGADSTWGLTAGGKLTLKAENVNHARLNGAAFELQAGINLTGLAGAGYVDFLAMTGFFQFPRGNAAWYGTSNASQFALLTGFFEIQSAPIAMKISDGGGRGFRFIRASLTAWNWDVVGFTAGMLMRWAGIPTELTSAYSHSGGTAVAAGATLALNTTSHYEIRCYPTAIALCIVNLPQITAVAADGQEYEIGNFGGIAVAAAVTINPNGADSIEYAAAGAPFLIITAGGVVTLRAVVDPGGATRWKIIAVVP